MNNKLLLFLVVVLLLGGVFVLSKNQSKTQPAVQNNGTGTENDLEKSDNEVKNEEDATEKADNEADEDVRVRVTDSGFEPQTITVKAGTKVIWRNQTDTTVNVSSADHPTHLVYPPLNLGNFEPDKSVNLVFKEPGTYKYHNHLDATKFGSVVVE